MRVDERGGVVRQGPAIDLREFGLRERGLQQFDLTPTAVADAVRRDDSVAADDCRLSVDCPDPGPAYEHVGAITASVSLARRPALAAVARSRGHTPPQADELAAVRDRLDALDPPAVDLREARERVADVSDAEAEWRERVATLQGRVQALRGVDVDSGDARGDLADAEDDLAEATRRLSEVETERIAAEQALGRARERACDHRETRRERLRLEDRAGNLRRAAREHLAERVRDDFEAARDAVPDGELPTETRDALAVARVADLDAPVVLARDADPFETPAAAVRWLDAAVIRI